MTGNDEIFAQISITLQEIKNYGLRIQTMQILGSIIHSVNNTMWHLLVFCKLGPLHTFFKISTVSSNNRYCHTLQVHNPIRSGNLISEVVPSGALFSAWSKQMVPFLFPWQHFLPEDHLHPNPYDESPL